MSTPGWPFDNIVMEDFFGTLKSECLYHTHDTTSSQLENSVAQYVCFYNFERINSKNDFTPYEIRSKAT